MCGIAWFYCCISAQHFIMWEHIRIYDIALWDISPRCSIIVWILFILMRTWLVWLIFTALEVHSVIGCAPRVLQSIQHTTAELASLSIFWSTSKTSQMFSKSQQKRQVLGDLRVYRVWSGKQVFGNLWSVLPFCTVSSQPQLDERGLYVWVALMCKTLADSWEGEKGAAGPLDTWRRT